MAPPPSISDAIPYRAELLRKAIHLLALVVPLGMAVLGKTWSLLLLAPLALLAFTTDVLRVRSERVAQTVRLIFGYMMRAEEQPPVGAPVSINGATWVLLSATLLVLVFPLHIAVASFVMFMISDAVAALVGRRFGRLHWGRTARTVEGSLGFLVTGLAVIALFPTIVFWTGAVSVGLACLAEIPPRPLNDNVRVPFVAAAVLFLLERFALGHEVALFFG